jgi:hypothetical protein
VCYPGDRELLNDLADYLASLHNLHGRPFSVARIPMGPYDPDGPYCAINRTYTNSLIINQKVLVPVYGAETDSAALATYAELMPDHEIIGIDSEYIIQFAGAVHCMTNLIHSFNPLVVLHRPIDEIPMGSSPAINFTINPGFLNTQASVFFKTVSEEEFTEVAAEFTDGIWSASLPAMVEDFSYYISGLVISGMTLFTATLPEGAPGSVFNVTVEDVSSVAEDYQPELFLRPYPNPWSESVAFSVTGLSPQEVVRVRILDPAGREVWRSAAGQSADGVYTAHWNGRNVQSDRVPPGVYLYRIEAPGRIYSGKVLRLGNP